MKVSPINNYSRGASGAQESADEPSSADSDDDVPSLRAARPAARGDYARARSGTPREAGTAVSRDSYRAKAPRGRMGAESEDDDLDKSGQSEGAGTPDEDDTGGAEEDYGEDSEEGGGEGAEDSEGGAEEDSDESLEEGEDDGEGGKWSEKVPAPPVTREERVMMAIEVNRKRKQDIAVLTVVSAILFAFFVVYYTGYLPFLDILHITDVLGPWTWLLLPYATFSMLLFKILRRDSKHQGRIKWLLGFGFCYTVWLLFIYSSPYVSYLPYIPDWMKGLNTSVLRVPFESFWVWFIPLIIVYQTVVIIALTRVSRDRVVPWTIFTICVEYTLWIFLLYFRLTPGIALQLVYVYKLLGPVQGASIPAKLAFADLMARSAYVDKLILFWCWAALVLYNTLIINFILRAPRHQQALWTFLIVAVESVMWLIGYFVEVMPLLLRPYERQLFGVNTWAYAVAALCVVMFGIILTKAPSVIRQGPILKALRNVYFWEASVGNAYELPKERELHEYPKKLSGWIYGDVMVEADGDKFLNVRSGMGKLCINCDYSHRCKYASSGFLVDPPCPPKWF